MTYILSVVLVVHCELNTDCISSTICFILHIDCRMNMGQTLSILFCFSNFTFILTHSFPPPRSDLFLLNSLCQLMALLSTHYTTLNSPLTITSVTSHSQEFVQPGHLAQRGLFTQPPAPVLVSARYIGPPQQPGSSPATGVCSLRHHPLPVLLT